MPRKTLGRRSRKSKTSKTSKKNRRSMKRKIMRGGSCSEDKLVRNVDFIKWLINNRNNFDSNPNKIISQYELYEIAFNHYNTGNNQFTEKGRQFGDFSRKC